MPWYYAGPEAKPVGPVSLEELHARRTRGVILPETYIIEDTGQPDPSRAWKRYSEVFAVNPGLPPIPVAPVTPPFAAPVPAASPAPLPPPPPPRLVPAPHPLFPSAAGARSHPVFTAPQGPDPYYSTNQPNSWCAWSLGLGLASPLLVPFCALGTMMALAAIFMGFGGLAQLHGHKGQPGRAYAIWGILVSAFTLLVSLAILAWWIHWFYLHAHEQTTTEQTSNDSQ